MIACWQIFGQLVGRVSGQLVGRFVGQLFLTLVDSLSYHTCVDRSEAVLDNLLSHLFVRSEVVV